MAQNHNLLVVSKLKELFPEHKDEVILQSVTSSLTELGPNLVISFDALLTMCIEILLNHGPADASCNRNANSPRSSHLAHEREKNCTSQVHSTPSQNDAPAASGFDLREDHDIGNEMALRTPGIEVFERWRTSSPQAPSSSSSQYSQSDSSSQQSDSSRCSGGSSGSNRTLEIKDRQYQNKTIDLSSTSNDSSVISCSDDENDFIQEKERVGDEALLRAKRGNLEANNSKLRSAKTQVTRLENSVLVDSAAKDFERTEKLLRMTLNVVPDVDDNHAIQMLQNFMHCTDDMAVNIVCSQLLDSKNYPKKVTKAEKSAVVKDDVGTALTDKDDDCSTLVSYEYQCQVKTVLAAEFPYISLKEITASLRKFKYHFIPCAKYLEQRLKNSMLGTSQLPKLVLLRNKRAPPPLPITLDLELAKDIERLKQLRQADTEAGDHDLASKINNEEYEKEGQLIECGCCFGEYPFESMVQCVEGHLFCTDCLRRYAEEAVFGSSRTALRCMTDGCNESFLKSHLQSCLSEKVMAKYEEREQEEALQLAGLADLVRCPACDYAAEIPPEEKVFRCLNPSCEKETCRHCKADWSEHFGLPCKEVEGKSQKNLRLTYEEKMTKAKVRICPKCSCGFMKSDGCNKMTCRCSTTMCYICRESNIGYNHFCNHLRDPGKSCTKCKRCSLWTDPTEDEEQALREIKKEAKVEQRKLAAENKVELTGNTEIGPSLSPPRPKRRKKDNHIHGHRNNDDAVARLHHDQHHPNHGVNQHPVAVRNHFPNFGFIALLNVDNGGVHLPGNIVPDPFQLRYEQQYEWD